VDLGAKNEWTVSDKAASVMSSLSFEKQKRAGIDR
jgi:hypothetical protein